MCSPEDRLSPAGKHWVGPFSQVYNGPGRCQKPGGGWTMRLPVDGYVLAIVATVALGFVLPCPAGALSVLGVAAQASIALLFFLYGARLAPRAVWQGLMHWRLQAL